MPSNERLSPALERRIVDAYLSKQTGKAVATLCGVTDVTVYNVLKRNGVVQRNGRLRYPNRDDHYLDAIDSVEKAYFLGLMASDGCIDTSNGRNRLKIALQEPDRNVLDAYSQILLKEDTVKVYPEPEGFQRQRAAWLSVSSRRLVERLIAFGIGPNKSFTCDPRIETLDENLFRAFLLGLHDGDGSVYWAHRPGRRKALVFSLVCSIAMAHRIEAAVWRFCRVHFCKSVKRCVGGDLIYLRLNDQRVIATLLNWLYTNPPPVYLERKHRLYCEFVRHRIELASSAPLLQRKPFLPLTVSPGIPAH